jgi:hypothetical protein
MINTAMWLTNVQPMDIPVYIPHMSASCLEYTSLWNKKQNKLRGP